MSASSSTALYLSISRYAVRFGVDRRTVYKWLNEPGILDWYRVKKVVRIKNQPPKNPHQQTPTCS